MTKQAFKNQLLQLLSRSEVNNFPLDLRQRYTIHNGKYVFTSGACVLVVNDSMLLSRAAKNYPNFGKSIDDLVTRSTHVVDIDMAALTRHIQRNSMRWNGPMYKYTYALTIDGGTSIDPQVKTSPTRTVWYNPMYLRRVLTMFDAHEIWVDDSNFPPALIKGKDDTLGIVMPINMANKNTKECD